MQATVSGRLVAADTTTQCAGCGSRTVSPVVVVATADDRSNDRRPHTYVRCAECGQRSWRRQGDEARPWRLWLGTYPLDTAFEPADRPEPTPAGVSAVSRRLARWQAPRRVLARA
jgi:hypothetical protein